MNKKIYLIAALNFIPLILLTNIEATQENHITHGPILGRLSAHGIGIWARTAKTGSFTVRYGLDPGELTEMTEPVKTLLDHDNTRWLAFPKPQVIFQYFDGRTGALRYAEAILAN